MYKLYALLSTGSGLCIYKGILSERDSQTVSTHAFHDADPGSNPAQDDDFFN